MSHSFIGSFYTNSHPSDNNNNNLVLPVVTASSFLIYLTAKFCIRVTRPNNAINPINNNNNNNNNNNRPILNEPFSPHLPQLQRQNAEFSNNHVRSSIVQSSEERELKQQNENETNSSILTPDQIIAHNNSVLLDSSIPTILMKFLFFGEKQIALEIPITSTCKQITQNYLNKTNRTTTTATAQHNNENDTKLNTIDYKFIYQGRVLKSDTVLAAVDGISAGSIVHVHRVPSTDSNSYTEVESKYQSNHQQPSYNPRLNNFPQHRVFGPRSRTLIHTIISQTSGHEQLSMIGMLLMLVFFLYTIIIGSLWGLYYQYGEELFNDIYFMVLMNVTIINAICIHQLFLKENLPFFMLTPVSHSENNRQRRHNQPNPLPNVHNHQGEILLPPLANSNNAFGVFSALFPVILVFIFITLF